MLKIVQKLRQTIHHSVEEDSRNVDNISPCQTKPFKVMQKEGSCAESDRRSVNSLCYLAITSQLFVECGMELLKCNVFLSQHDSPQFENLGIRIFTTKALQYEPYCDDFGPMNLLAVTRFVETLDCELCTLNSPNLVYLVDPGKRNLTNAAFLLGCYLILRLGQSPQRVAEIFSGLESKFEGFRDATHSCSATTFRLWLIDCWSGLHHAKTLHWIAMPSSENSNLWGQIDMIQYEQHDDPLRGNLHIVVPGRFAAFGSPKYVEGRKYEDNFNGEVLVSRDFAPSYFCEIFEALGVSTVIRLNETWYSRSEFVKSGIEHFDLFFEDCTIPSPDILACFFEVTDQAKGLVAVHCKAGLGRTGTLIGLSLLREYGFSAREAIGWLRIMRPGSVIGQQQDFLCAVEGCLRESPARACGYFARPSSSPLLLGSGPESDCDSPHKKTHRTWRSFTSSPLFSASRGKLVKASCDSMCASVSSASVRQKDHLSQPIQICSSEVLAEQVSSGALRRAAAKIEGVLGRSNGSA